MRVLQICFQGLSEMENAVKFYKDILTYDSMHVEAIACIATHHFYTDQPEIALKFYRYKYQVTVYLISADFYTRA